MMSLMIQTDPRLPMLAEARSLMIIVLTAALFLRIVASAVFLVHASMVVSFSNATNMIMSAFQLH